MKLHNQTWSVFVAGLGVHKDYAFIDPDYCEPACPDAPLSLFCSITFGAQTPDCYRACNRSFELIVLNAKFALPIFFSAKCLFSSGWQSSDNHRVRGDHPDPFANISGNQAHVDSPTFHEHIECFSRWSFFDASNSDSSGNQYLKAYYKPMVTAFTYNHWKTCGFVDTDLRWFLLQMLLLGVFGSVRAHGLPMDCNDVPASLWALRRVSEGKLLQDARAKFIFAVAY